MENIHNFRKDALIIIYPSGLVKEVSIDEKLLHLKYYIDLYQKDDYFKKIVDENEIVIPSNISKAYDINSYSIDKDLARCGIICLHNLFINKIRENENYINTTPPQFYITIPSDLTKEQTLLLKELCSNYDMSCSVYGIYYDDEIENILYDDLLSIINIKNKYLKIDA